MTELEFTLRFRDAGGGLRGWLRELERRSVMSGWDLVRGLAGPDNVATADKALLALEGAGWIRRGNLRPSRGAQPSGYHWEVARGSGIEDYLVDWEVLEEARRRPTLWAGRGPVYGLLRQAGFPAFAAREGARSVPTIHEGWVSLEVHGPQARRRAEDAERDRALAGLVPGSPEEGEAAAALEERWRRRSETATG